MLAPRERGVSFSPEFCPPVGRDLGSSLPLPPFPVDWCRDAGRDRYEVLCRGRAARHQALCRKGPELGHARGWGVASGSLLL